jgi:hypothetical protein|tara:strand:- start:473 stop:787 length:315 start_codon:yes stop_codon:yes gene_type:complete
MKIKNDFTIETAAEKLKKELSSHIKITVRKNVINNDKKWLDIDKDSFVGIRVSFFGDGVNCITYVPNFFARAFFGGIISGIFHHSSRTKFKKQIETFLISEFYE